MIDEADNRSLFRPPERLIGERPELPVARDHAELPSNHRTAPIKKKITMLIHTVLFWLKDDLEDAQRVAFLKGLESLKEFRQPRLFISAHPQRRLHDPSWISAMTTA